MASMEVDPALSDTLMHLSGYIFLATNNAALRGKERNSKASGTSLLFGRDNRARVQRVRGIFFLRQLQERTDVILPILATAIHQFPDRLANMSDVIDMINQYRPSHPFRPELDVYFLNLILPYPTMPASPLPSRWNFVGFGDVNPIARQIIPFQ